MITVLRVYASVLGGGFLMVGASHASWELVSAGIVLAGISYPWGKKGKRRKKLAT